MCGGFCAWPSILYAGPTGPCLALARVVHCLVKGSCKIDCAVPGVEEEYNGCRSYLAELQDARHFFRNYCSHAVDDTSPRSSMSYIAASNGSRQPMFLAVMGLLLLLSCVSVGLRIYCRVFRVRKLGIDDSLIVAALMVTIVLGVMNGFHVSYGTGYVNLLLLHDVLITVY